MRPMRFIELDPELARKAIEGYQNELDPEIKALDAFYRQFNCPACGSVDLDQQIAARPSDGGHAFSDKDTLTARKVLRCRICRCLFDPHTSIVLERGNGTRTMGGR